MSDSIEKVKNRGDEINSVEEDNVSEKYLTLDPVDDTKQARNTTLVVHSITSGGAEYALPNKPKIDKDADNGYIDPNGNENENDYMNLNENASPYMNLNENASLGGGDSRVAVAVPLETSNTVTALLQEPKEIVDQNGGHQSQNANSEVGKKSRRRASFRQTFTGRKWLAHKMNRKLSFH